ncbi:MAG: hypothetical protein HOG71_16675 [Bacteroidetes bacterium]|nr:hypothetical protein [Bacteroidota bacterium]
MTPAIRKINRLPPYLVFFNTTFHSATYFVAFDWMYALLDTSSVVTVSSSPLSIPDNARGKAFS